MTEVIIQVNSLKDKISVIQAVRDITGENVVEIFNRIVQEKRIVKFNLCFGSFNSGKILKIIEFLKEENENFVIIIDGSVSTESYLMKIIENAKSIHIKQEILHALEATGKKKLSRDEKEFVLKDAEDSFSF